ncbi:MAG: CobW family GTP-binding protein [Pikeienuella sp.]
MSGPLIPCLIVGGYLGAGKTTLINAFLRDPGGLRATVLVNDFGKINIDADLIENTSGDTVSLTNGCACCSIGDDLLAAAVQAVQADPRPDLLIVEASGVSKPARIATLLLGVSGLAPARCLTVIDNGNARKLSKDKFVAGLFRNQIETAHMLSLNRCSTSQDRALMDGILAKHAPNAPRVSDLTAALSTLASGNPKLSQANPAADSLQDPPFQTRTFQVRQDISQVDVERWAMALPDHVQRVKGFVSVSSEGRPRILRLSQTGGDCSTQEITGASPMSLGQVVVIGIGSLTDIPAL